MKCLNCGREVDKSLFPEDLTYCPYCGQEMGTASIGERLQFCPYCGQKLLTQTKFCPHCGKKLVFTGTRFDVHDIQQMGKDFIDKKAIPIAKAIRNKFGRERKIKKLYDQWSEFSELPPEEVPSVDNLRQKSAEEKDKGHQQPDDADID
jgi:DNA-directed RNA polymerase subunit RPC12/RpoP